MSALAKYDAARRALSLAVSVDEVKDIRDKALALQAYALQARDRVLIDHATEIRLRAERRAGELLAEMEKNKGGGEHGVGRRGSNNAVADSDRIPPPKLSDLNISKTQSSKWQKLAAATDADFEQIITAATQKASDAVDRAQQPKRKPRPGTGRKRKQPASKGNGADIVAATLREVKAIVRDAIIFKMDAEQRLVFVDELKKAVLTIVAEATAQETDADHWAEATH